MTAVPLPDGAMPAHIASASEVVGGAVIVPSIFGIDGGTTHIADMLAAAGVSTVVPDLFWRVAPGPLGFGDDTLARERAEALDPRAALRDLSSTVHHLQSALRGPVVALGLGVGGRLARLLAARGSVSAALTWHSDGLSKLVSLAPQIRCPLSMHFGDQDELVPLSDVARLRNTFGRSEGVRLHLHPGVGQGFAHPGHPSYSRIAANAALADAIRMVRQLHELSLA